MDRLCEIARRHHLLVIEDCAEAHGATCRGKKVGSFGDMGCFSFLANKVITTGEGGMVTTDNPALAERLRLLRNMAFTKPRFWHELAGYNFRMTGFQAAMGIVQVGKIEQIIEQKRRVALTYTRYLRDLPGFRLPFEAEWARNVYWMYAVVLNQESGMTRDQLTNWLWREGIETRTFFCPINQQPCLQAQPGFRVTPCPVADRLWTSGFYLPSSYTLTEETIKSIAETIQRAAEHAEGQHQDTLRE